MGASSKQARRGVPLTGRPEVPAELRRQFSEFRRTHALGARVPDALRTGVVGALDQGVGRWALRRELGLGSQQLEDWQRDAARTRRAARIFEVADAGERGEPGVRGDAGERGDALELRLGGFSIVIRQARDD